MTSKARKLAAAGLVLVVLAGLLAWFLLSRPKAPPPAPAPPPPPPSWRCGTAYGKEICKRQLPPPRPAP